MTLRRLLVCSPDYASHWTALSTICTAVARRGVEVVVATGPSMRARAEAAGVRSRALILGAGRNPGVARVEQQLAAEADELAAFFEATRAGIVPALLHQARRRAHDLLHQPERVIADLGRIIDEEGPDLVLVDHVSFVSTLAALALGAPFATFVPGHPSQLPVGDERYGLPPVWPVALRPGASELDALRVACDAARERFAAQFTDVLSAHGRTPPKGVDDPFRLHGTPLLLHHPEALADPARRALLPPDAHLVGPCVRAEPLLPDVARWCAQGAGAPLVVVALGTFLSARGDLLGVIADGLRTLGGAVRVAIATGSTSPACLGDVPPSWLVRPVIPQVGLLRDASVLVHHGGNNSAMEALAAGASQVVLPLSTDQPAVAADLERAGLGVVLDARTCDDDDVAGAVRAALQRTGDARDLAAGLAGTGPDRCAELLTR